ncbi:hypothetical protein [Streptomyces sp. ST1020]|uniref:hypothetical protein n=1 Tax=Streptomyces sp. ST1020 TaxID=1848901 RepID=UPI0034C6521E
MTADHSAGSRTGHREGLAVHGGQRAPLPYGHPGERVAGAGAGRRQGAVLAVADDQRQRVAVAVPGQPRDVEEAPVEDAVGDQAQGVLRDHPGVAALAPHREADLLAALCADERGDPAVGADGHAVPGDQGDGRGRGAGAGGCGSRRFAVRRRRSRDQDPGHHGGQCRRSRAC